MKNRSESQVKQENHDFYCKNYKNWACKETMFGQTSRSGHEQLNDYSKEFHHSKTKLRFLTKKLRKTKNTNLNQTVSVIRKQMLTDRQNSQRVEIWHKRASQFQKTTIKLTRNSSQSKSATQSAQTHPRNYYENSKNSLPKWRTNYHQDFILWFQVRNLLLQLPLLAMRRTRQL